MKRRLTVETLAERAGLTVARIEKFEDGSRAPYLEELFWLADALRDQPTRLMRRIMDAAGKARSKTTIRAGARVLAVAILAVTALAASPGIAQDVPASSPSAQANSFLKLSEGQRYWWLHGAATTTAHMIAMYDERKGDCAAKWYLNDRAAAQRLVEDTLRRYPAEDPTTVVISLMTQACGELTPAANR